MGDFVRFADNHIIHVPIKAALAGYDKHPNGISVETIGQIWANGPEGPFEEDTLLLVMNANRLRIMVSAPMNPNHPQMEITNFLELPGHVLLDALNPETTIVARFEFPINYEEQRKAGLHYPYLFTRDWKSMGHMETIHSPKGNKIDAILYKGVLPEMKMRHATQSTHIVHSNSISGSAQPSYVRIYMDGTMIEQACRTLPPAGRSSHKMEIILPLPPETLLELEHGRMESINIRDAYKIELGDALNAVINYCRGGIRNVLHSQR